MTRRECATDRRGTLAEMTTPGGTCSWPRRPRTSTSVRRHLVDVLTPEEFAAAGAAGQKVADRILSGGELSDPPECGVAPPGS